MLARTGVISSSYLPQVVANGYYRTITLDQPASDLTNFPVLFSGTFDYLKTISNSGKVNNSNGYDIVFYSDSALTTILDFERVNYNPLTGDVEFWIRIPTLTSASATVIYLAYGNTTITTDQQDAANTWDSTFVGVWHLKDGTTLSLEDSKGVINGTNSGIQAAAGVIDGGAFCDGASSADFGNNADFTTGDMTISLWSKAVSINAYLFNKIDIDGDGAGWNVYWNQPNTGEYSVWLYLQTDLSNWKQVGYDNINLGDGVWRHYAFTRSGTNLAGYVNNSSTFVTTQGAGTIGSITTSANLTLGANQNGSFKLTGYVDEIRISNVVRNADWLTADYSNQNDPANFYAIGSETPA